MKIIIDQQELEVNPGVTILEAARQHGVNMPTLCYHEAFGGQGMCRMCMVEVTKGNSRQIVAACTYPINTEIEVQTSTPAIEKGRRTIVSLLYRSAPDSQFMQAVSRVQMCGEPAGDKRH